MANVSLERVDAILTRHGCQRDNLIGVLLDCQEQFRHLPRELIERVATRVEVPVATVLGIATFYRGFTLKPMGIYPVAVCTGTACHVLGATKLVEAFERELKIKKGDTTGDGMFSLHGINCLGFCGQAPAVRIGEDMYGRVTQTRIAALMRRYRPKDGG
jgi:NADH:ubiquinone oxidoreductase subunit E